MDFFLCLAVSHRPDLYNMFLSQKRVPLLQVMLQHGRSPSAEQIASPGSLKRKDIIVNKDQIRKKGASVAQTEREAEIARRARITASLREQRLKRDAEIATTASPVTPKRRSSKQVVR
jgi:hypothetical protein